MFKIAVLASTRGTDLQAIIKAIKSKKLPGVEISCVITNQKNCLALKRARKAGLETYFIDPKGKIREEFDEEIAEILQDHEVQLIVLVGYMRILSKTFIEKFAGKIINVHPSLIPSFCGPRFFDKNVHEEVLRRGVKITGCTIHFVTEEIDSGPIILQKAVEVSDHDTPESLKKKVQKLEKKWYPKVIEWIKDGKVKIKGNRTEISNS